LFLAATMSGGEGQSLHPLGCPVAYLRYFRRPDVDIAIVRGAGPPSREIVGWVRRRQTTCLLGHLWDREPYADLAIDVYLSDAGTGPGAGRGVAVLDDRHLYTINCRKFWLVGRYDEPLLLALTRDGPVPTLTRPFDSEAEFERGKANADKLLSALLWESTAR
jgi:hypothetical protein